MDIESCVHEDVNVEGFCTKCGEFISMYISDVTPLSDTKAKIITIIPELTKLYTKNIPEDVLYTADAIHLKIRENENKVHKGKPRKRQIFLCLYLAYKERGYTEIDYYQLAEDMGLDKGDAQKADSYLIYYDKPSLQQSPLDLIAGYCRLLHLTDRLDAINACAQRIYGNNNSQLKRTSPQIVAGSIIGYYCKITGIKTVTPNLISNVSHASDVTIRMMIKKLEILDNK
ncbi:Putative transcription factor TFIIB [Orpheovirus IHUMI-LCC2]|uniref:Transcription factor TFIIB n=1 Tax=Orpheovirus IHUMI-LCC2 TaxID=2023057 RepID=A0A2I2L5S7_9VIRU|nr:Putative transcription factor TFIIB [Orpheovirus IHUMI-LCC2]SNW62902.1 Putative transcription factor TFIIB [Orpheovirus IHUMI-LCC2]